ncbi:MAG: SDR family oxidoreductase [Rubinisphaera brasiliensis]|uniref:SDR family oxidoreductase n=1 Tax=Rubinisphaera brasiliensis TaxID=119 RepID=UPI00391D7F08
MSFEVQGKVCLVTGANRGIGRAIVDALVKAGVEKVYAAVRSVDSAGPLVEDHGDKVVPLPLDLNDPETITASAKTARDVELVINNAGILKSASALSEGAIVALQAEMEVNVYGLIRMAQAFAPVLKANGGGAFVQLNSVASLKSFPAFSTYAASKAASYSMTQALLFDLGEQGTQVVSVHPGPIATDMADHAGLTEIAEPASLVADAILAALSSGEFHAWPDTMAKQFGEAYENFSSNVVLADGSEG